MNHTSSQLASSGKISCKGVKKELTEHSVELEKGTKEGNTSDNKFYFVSLFHLQSGLIFLFM